MSAAVILSFNGLNNLMCSSTCFDIQLIKACSTFAIYLDHFPSQVGSYLWLVLDILACFYLTGSEIDQPPARNSSSRRQQKVHIVTKTNRSFIMTKKKEKRMDEKCFGKQLKIE